MYLQVDYTLANCFPYHHLLQPSLTMTDPFVAHLRFFADSKNPNQVTLLSGLRNSIRLGLDFPVALCMSIGIRLMYAPFPFLRPIDISSIPPSAYRSHMVESKLDKESYSLSDIISRHSTHDPARSAKGLLGSIFDRGHALSLWTLAADVKTGLVSKDDFARFQKGTWLNDVAERRKYRAEDKSNVLPLYRGGPISVVGHSWAVDKLLGVKVYKPE